LAYRVDSDRTIGVGEKIVRTPGFNWRNIGSDSWGREELHLSWATAAEE